MRVRSPGFTLIELLVVFTLLALLLTLAVPRYFNATQGAAEKVRAQNMATLRDAIDKFRADRGHYPKDLPELVSAQYLRAVPFDPVSNSTDWVVVQNGVTQEPGVFDVQPPSAAAPVPRDAASVPVPGASGSP